MDHLFPVKFQTRIQEQEPSFPINVPFTYQNECFVITQEDCKDVYITRNFTINKWNPCLNQQITPNYLAYSTNELSQVIQHMMNALAQEQQKQIQNQFYQASNQATPIFNHIPHARFHDPNSNITCDNNQFMQNNPQITQIFHHNQKTSTTDLRDQQNINLKKCKSKKCVRFLVDGQIYHTGGAQIDDNLQQDVQMNHFNDKMSGTTDYLM